MLGIYAPGETVTDADAERGLVVLNYLMDGWADEYLYVYKTIPTTIDLVVDQAAYAIGSTGATTIVQERPARISMGPGAATATIATVDSPVNVVSSVEWNMIEAIASGSGTPDTLFYDPLYPNGILNLAPVPDALGTLVFQAWYPIQRFNTLSDPDVTLAPGCDETIKTNLAVRLKPYFSEAVLNPAITAGAITSKQNLRHTNLLSRAMIGRTGVPITPAQTAR